jgi:hypothetical protein
MNLLHSQAATLATEPNRPLYGRGFHSICSNTYALLDANSSVDVRFKKHLHCLNVRLPHMQWFTSLVPYLSAGSAFIYGGQVFFVPPLKSRRLICSWTLCHVTSSSVHFFHERQQPHPLCSDSLGDNENVHSCTPDQPVAMSIPFQDSDTCKRGKSLLFC